MSGFVLDPKVLESLPPRVLQNTPAYYPPPGFQPNFAHPSTCVPAILTVCCVFLAFAVVSLAIRIYVKFAIAKRWTWDDLTITLGLMLAIVHIGLFFNASLNGAVGKHQYEVHLDKLMTHAFSMGVVVLPVLPQPCLGLIKASLFIQYYAIFGTKRSYRIAICIGAAFEALAYVAATIAIFVLAMPRNGATFVETMLSPPYLKVLLTSIPVGVLGLLIDCYLLILPFPIMIKLQMATSKKLGVLFVFTLGGLGVVASAATLAYRVNIQSAARDTTWKLAYALLWIQIEMFVGIIISNTPSVKQFFSHSNFSPLKKPAVEKPEVEQNRTFLSTRQTTTASDASFRLSLHPHTTTSFDDLITEGSTNDSQIQVVREYSVVYAHDKPDDESCSAPDWGRKLRYTESDRLV